MRSVKSFITSGQENTVSARSKFWSESHFGRAVILGGTRKSQKLFPFVNWHNHMNPFTLGSCESFSGPPPHNMVHRNPPPKPGEGPPPRQMSRGQSKDEEDTMRNLRKTFAGIFGDM